MSKWVIINRNITKEESITAPSCKHMRYFGSDGLWHKTLKETPVWTERRSVENTFDWLRRTYWHLDDADVKIAPVVPKSKRERTESVAERTESVAIIAEMKFTNFDDLSAAALGKFLLDRYGGKFTPEQINQKIVESNLLFLSI